MSKTTAHMIIESVDMIDADLHEEALITLALAEMEDTEDNGLESIES